MPEDDKRVRIQVPDRLLRLIHEWVAKNMKVISPHQQLKWRVIQSMTREAGMRRVEAENLFDTLVNDSKAMAGSPKGTLYGNRAKCVLPSRAAMDHWWSELGQHPPPQIYPLGPGAKAAPDFPTSRADDQDCLPCTFIVEDQPIRGIALQRSASGTTKTSRRRNT